MISILRSACSSSTSATAGDSRTLQSCGAGLSPSPMNSRSIALLLAATGRGTAAPAACNTLSMPNSWCSQPPNFDNATEIALESLILAETARQQLQAGNPDAACRVALRGLPNAGERPLVAETFGVLLECANEL